MPPLPPYRILDLTDDRGHLAGFILAQLGADVVVVEPPGGARTRRAGPHPGDHPDPEVSLSHWAYARGKRSVVLEHPSELDALVGTADMVLDCGLFPVDLAELRRRHPALVTVSITPFGGDGPKRDWAATDLIIAAASGIMSVTGDSDRPPVRIGVPQSWLLAAANAAFGGVVALHERARSGRGQHVDVSAQESVMLATQFAMTAALVDREGPGRMAGGMHNGPFRIQFVHECADGHASVIFMFGGMFGPYTTRLFRWMYEDGFCEADLRDKNWITFGADVAEGRESVAEYDRAKEVLARFVKSKTRAELFEAALRRELMIAPVSTTRDIIASDQLESRRYWDDVELNGQTIRFPGPFAKFSRSPLRRLGPPEPLPDREGSQVMPDTVVAPTPAGSDGRDAPLAGVKILDFAWAVAGPMSTRLLADHGAIVVRVESERRPDVIRMVTPFRGDFGDAEGSLQWHSVNAGKLGVTIQLSHPSARAIILDLVRWADVVVESFAPGVMAKLGLDYEELRLVKPDVIMLSSSLAGQDGPLSRFAAVGTQGAAMAGFYPIVGWPDRLPAGPFMAYSDYTAPSLTATAVLAALEWRRRTGDGQYIDLAQIETSLHFLTPVLLDEQVNGRTAGRHGNEDPLMAPHGAYPAAGQDRWIALACETDDQWATLAGLLGREDLVALPTEERRVRRRELDDLLGAWTSGRDPGELQEQLQSVGIPAHQVQGSPECCSDPQLVHRGHFVEVPHPRYGTTFVEAPGFRLSETPAQIRWPGPTLGQHNDHVLTEILDYEPDHITELVIDGALE